MAGKLWTPLQPGDLVEVIAPGMTPQSGTLKKVPGFLKSWGLRCQIDPKILGKDLLCSNTREQRRRMLLRAFKNKESKMIWCIRGGYGSFQLLEDLKKIKPGTNKIVMGLSDITSLHQFLVQEWGWACIHGLHIGPFARGEASRAEVSRFKNLLFGKTSEVVFKPKALNKAAKKKGLIPSEVVGGNLITLQASFGTSFQVKTRNKILFLEDIGERAYRVDRVLEHMRQLGLFKSIKAIVFGQFVGGKEPGGKASLVPKLLKEFAEKQSFPVLSGLSCGHGKNQYPLPLGTQTELKLGSRPEMTIQSGARLQ